MYFSPQMPHYPSPKYTFTANATYDISEIRHLRFTVNATLFYCHNICPSLTSMLSFLAAKYIPRYQVNKGYEMSSTQIQFRFHFLETS